MLRDDTFFWFRSAILNLSCLPICSASRNRNKQRNACVLKRQVINLLEKKKYFIYEPNAACTPASCRLSAFFWSLVQLQTLRTEYQWGLCCAVSFLFGTTQTQGCCTFHLTTPPSPSLRRESRCVYAKHPRYLLKPALFERINGVVHAHVLLWGPSCAGRHFPLCCGQGSVVLQTWYLRVVRQLPLLPSRCPLYFLLSLFQASTKARLC